MEMTVARSDLKTTGRDHLVLESQAKRIVANRNKNARQVVTASWSLVWLGLLSWLGAGTYLLSMTSN